MSRLLAVDEALARVLTAAVPPGEMVELPLLEALGHVLSHTITSPVDVPMADNSAMDGYALRATEAGQALPVSQRIPAGAVGGPLAAGTAARIFTGAAVPPGADAVVMQENCVEEDGAVWISGPVAVGQHIRRRGQDLRAGEPVLRKGRVLRPQDLGLLASVGCATVRVYRPLRIAVLSTGDELIEPGAAAPSSGEQYNSNRYMLAGLLRRLNMDVLDGGIVPDDPESTGRALLDTAARADCVITTGGVSVGEEDHVKAQVQRYGRLDLWKLAIKPGKPLAFGSIGETPFIGLPGNPASVFVTFCLIARPFLLCLQGADEPAPPRLRARAGFTVDKPGNRQDYLRVTVEVTSAGLVATRYPNQSSGVLSSVCRSNALALIPVGATVAEGDELDVLLLDMLM